MLNVFKLKILNFKFYRYGANFFTLLVSARLISSEIFVLSLLFVKRWLLADFTRRSLPAGVLLTLFTVALCVFNFMVLLVYLFRGVNFTFFNFLFLGHHCCNLVSCFKWSAFIIQSGFFGKLCKDEESVFNKCVFPSTKPH